MNSLTYGYTEFLYPCSRCAFLNKKKLVCGKCKSAFYCDEECQREHWRHHKRHCDKLRDEYENTQKMLDETAKCCFSTKSLKNKVFSKVRHSLLTKTDIIFSYGKQPGSVHAMSWSKCTNCRCWLDMVFTQVDRRNRNELRYIVFCNDGITPPGDVGRCFWIVIKFIPYHLDQI